MQKKSKPFPSLTELRNEHLIIELRNKANKTKSKLIYAVTISETNEINVMQDIDNLTMIMILEENIRRAKNGNDLKIKLNKEN